MEITFTIPDEEKDRVINALVWKYPQRVNGVPDDTFTDPQWTKESIRRLLVGIVRKYEYKIAREALDIIPDNDLIT